jgi:hypothetical protein
LQDAGPSHFDGRGPEAGAAPALDLAHLARQCFGDTELEMDLLRQFRSLSLGLAGRLAEDVRLPRHAKADLAHRLRGSALAVGAAKVARAAAVVEDCARAATLADAGRPASAGEWPQAVGALSAAVAEAAAEIDRLLG